VDPQVADDIFNKCIRGVLKDKLVVLVTHQLQFLKQCEKILVLKNGSQNAIGCYDDITKTGFDIEEILKSYNAQLAGKKSAMYAKETEKRVVIADKKSTTKDKADDLATEATEKKKPSGDLHTAEEVEKGSVSIQDFKNLLSFSVGHWGFVLYFAISISAAGCQLFTTYWVSLWVNQDMEEQ